MARKKKTGEHVTELVDIKDVSPTDVELLVKEIADLKAKLKVSDEKRTEAEQHALELAETQAGMEQAQEIPTGKTISVTKCKGYKTVGYKESGRKILEPIWHEVELPTFFYKINLPPVGGLGLVVNQMPLAHGAMMEFDIDTLRSVKEMIYRAWDHERNIKGNDENAYRQTGTNKSILRSQGGVA